MRLLLVPLILVSLEFSLLEARPQTENQSPVMKPEAYEVVSIKPSKPGSPGVYQILPDGFWDTDTTFDSLVYGAYGIVSDIQVVAMPSWATTEKFEVQARVDAGTADAWKKLTDKERQKQERPMLQALLADRCKLKVHFEQKELPVYELVIAKGGLKMKEAAPGEMATEEIAAGIRLTAHAMATESLVYTLSGTDGRLIVDKTGLGEKKFDFELHWRPDDLRMTADAGPSLFTALEEQLGLKLVPSKDPVNVLVIDHMEQPSPN
ncbi:MAG TPA: TIGR03435 family protein [Terracidiphilus sp.]|nr:TIGR03435 family protein [Terracidiphilus sp.]